MSNNTVHQEVSGSLEAELERLSEFIKERFPAEAVGVELKVRTEAIRLAIDLLERLWRWEH